MPEMSTSGLKNGHRRPFGVCAALSASPPLNEIPSPQDPFLLFRQALKQEFDQKSRVNLLPRENRLLPGGG